MPEPEEVTDKKEAGEIPKGKESVVYFFSPDSLDFKIRMVTYKRVSSKKEEAEDA